MVKYNKKFINNGNSLVEIALLQEEGAIIESPLTTGIYIYEAVIDNSYELNSILEIFHINKPLLLNNINDFNNFSNTIQDLLDKHKIKFIYSGEASDKSFISLASYNDTSDTIILFYSKKITGLNSSNYKIFLKEIQTLLGHELIHREQSIRNKQKETWEKNNTQDIEKYLKDKREIMAYAWQFINTFRMSSISDENIKKILRTDSQIKFDIGGNLFKKYHILFNIDNPVLKRLYKYMYQYLEK